MKKKGKDYSELPAVTMVCITKEDIFGGKRGCYLVERKTDGQVKEEDVDTGLKNTINISSGKSNKPCRV